MKEPLKFKNSAQVQMLKLKKALLKKRVILAALKLGNMLAVNA